jgi:hypothetical protein
MNSRLWLNGKKLAGYTGPTAYLDEYRKQELPAG